MSLEDIPHFSRDRQKQQKGMYGENFDQIQEKPLELVAILNFWK